MANFINQTTAPFSDQSPIYGTLVSSKSDDRYRRFGYQLNFSMSMKSFKKELGRSEGSITKQMQEFQQNWLSKPSIINKEQTLTLKWSQVES